MKSKLNTFSLFFVTALIGFSAFASDEIKDTKDTRSINSVPVEITSETLTPLLEDEAKLDPLTIVPEDVFILILDFLEGKDFYNARGVCHSWNRLCHDQSLVFTAETLKDKARELRVLPLYRMGKRFKKAGSLLAEYSLEYLNSDQRLLCATRDPRVLAFDLSLGKYRLRKDLSTLTSDIIAKEIDNYCIYERIRLAQNLISPIDSHIIEDLIFIRLELSQLFDNYKQKLKHTDMARYIINVNYRKLGTSTVESLVPVLYEIHTNYCELYERNGGSNSHNQDNLAVNIRILKAAIKQIDLIFNIGGRGILPGDYERFRMLNKTLATCYTQFAENCQDTKQTIDIRHEATICWLKANDQDKQNLISSYYMEAFAHLHRLHELISAYSKEPVDIQAVIHKPIAHLQDAEFLAKETIKDLGGIISGKNLESIRLIFSTTINGYVDLARLISDNPKEESANLLKALNLMEYLFAIPEFIPQEKDREKLSRIQYEVGRSLTRINDYKGALPYYELAAQAGHATAMANLSLN